VKRVDKETVFNQFTEIEQRVENLIESCKRLEVENSALESENQRLTLALQEKESAERENDELKELVRNKIESLMGRLDNISEEQV
jgi:FtsZ-binding cell division protein ZapB